MYKPQLETWEFSGLWSARLTLQDDQGRTYMFTTYQYKTEDEAAQAVKRLVPSWLDCGTETPAASAAHTGGV